MIDDIMGSLTTLIPIAFVIFVQIMRYRARKAKEADKGPPVFTNPGREKPRKSFFESAKNSWGKLRDSIEGGEEPVSAADDDAPRPRFFWEEENDDKPVPAPKAEDAPSLAELLAKQAPRPVVTVPLTQTVMPIVLAEEDGEASVSLALEAVPRPIPQFRPVHPHEKSTVRLGRMHPLKQAVLWAEILGPPKALQ